MQPNTPPAGAGGSRLPVRLIVGSAVVLSALLIVLAALFDRARAQENQGDQGTDQQQSVLSRDGNVAGFRAVVVPTQGGPKAVVAPPCPPSAQNALQDRNQQQDQDRQDQDQNQQNQQTFQQQPEQQLETLQEDLQRNGLDAGQQNQDGQNQDGQNQQDQDQQQNQRDQQNQQAQVLDLATQELPAGSNAVIIPANTGERTVLVPACSAPNAVQFQDNGLGLIVLPIGATPSAIPADNPAIAVTGPVVLPSDAQDVDAVVVPPCMQVTDRQQNQDGQNQNDGQNQDDGQVSFGDRTVLEVQGGNDIVTAPTCGQDQQNQQNQQNQQQGQDDQQQRNRDRQQDGGN